MEKERWGELYARGVEFGIGRPTERSVLALELLLQIAFRF